MTRRRRMTRRVRAVLLLSLRLTLVAVIGIGALLWFATRSPITAPDWLTGRVVAALDDALAPSGLAVSLDRLSFDLRNDFTPAIRAEGMSLADRTGTRLLALNQFVAVFSAEALLIGRVTPTALRASGATVSLGRDERGQLSLRLGGQTVLEGAPSPGAMLDRLRGILDTPRFAGLASVGVEDVSLSFDDAYRGHRLSSEHGYLRLERASPDALRLDADLGQIAGAGEVGAAPGHVGVSVDSPEPGAATGRVSLRGVVPARVAGVAGVLPLADLLARIDAPVSLALRGGLDSDGQVGALSGSISVGDGSLDLPGRETPLEIDQARSDLALSAAKDDLTLSDLSVSAPMFQVSGRLELRADAAAGAPDGAIVAQAALDRLSVTAKRFYAAPLVLDGLWADLRYNRNSDEVEIASLTATQDDLRLVASGNLRAMRDRAGPGRDDAAPGLQSLALDVTADRITPAQLVALWPDGPARGAREWISERVERGEFRNAHAALRVTRGGEPDLGVTFEMADATVRPVPALPPITDGQGMGQITGHTLAIRVASARMAPPEGAAIALRDGDIQIADFTTPHWPLQVRFDARSDARSALSLLSHPPFRDDESGSETDMQLAPDEAEGDVALTVSLSIPLRKSTRFKDVDFAVTGTIDDFRSTELLPGRSLTADTLEIDADPRKITVSGPAKVDAQPMDVRYTHPLRDRTAPEGTPPAPSTVRAEGPLTDALARSFGVALPTGAVTGAGRIVADITLPRGAPPDLKLRGDLAGLSLSLPALGIGKSRSTAGTLDVSGQLGANTRLDPIKVAFPGLSLDASTDLVQGQGAEAVTLKRVRIGNWLDARGTFWPGGTGTPRVALSGGTLDIRNLPKRGGGGGPGLAGIDVALNRVVVTDRIALTDMRGQLSGRLSGVLKGRMNGGPAVDVTLSAQDGGLAIRLKGTDAGATLRAAKLFDTLHGGALDLRLVPAGRERYRGQAHITDAAVRDAPAMADLLSALSIVGGLDQLAGEGIRFSDISADFMFSPDRIDVQSGSAVGASIGLSCEGSVDLRRDWLDLQGVVSPVFFLNRAGGVRPGEGLIGINYRLTGPSAKPKISVNPLSILAPGFLREIFRGRNQPPDVSRESGN